MYLRPFARRDYLYSPLVNTFRFRPVFPYLLPPVRSLPRDGATPRDHPSQGHGSSPAAFHQIPRYTADECASIVPGHLPSPFRRSFDAELLAVPAPERGLAAAASSSSTLGTGCSPWSTGRLPLLCLSPCRRCAELPPIDCWHCPVHQRQPCTPLVTFWVFSSLAAVGEPSCHLPSASVHPSLRCAWRVSREDAGFVSARLDTQRALSWTQRAPWEVK